MSDLISRQAAIDAICKHGTDLERIGITYIAVASHKQVTVDLLEQLPSVQPKLIKAKIGHDPTVDKTEILKKMLLDEPIVLLPSVQPEIIPLASETPCDVCRYNPPSSMDGKPCCICPAEGREG